jgi:hypothetical protein
MPARKKFKKCGHLSFGRTCARCREADRLENGYATKKGFVGIDRCYTTKEGRMVEPDPEEAARLRKPTHAVNSPYRQRVMREDA